MMTKKGTKKENRNTHLDGRQQTSYTCNKWMNKWNWDCIARFNENIQNCAGCADYCVEYARKSTDLLIAITQSWMYVLDNLECDTGKTGSRASTLICLIESFSGIISFKLSPVPVPPRALASISRMVLNGHRKEMVIL